MSELFFCEDFSHGHVIITTIIMKNKTYYWRSYACKILTVSLLSLHFRFGTGSFYKWDDSRNGCNYWSSNCRILLVPNNCGCIVFLHERLWSVDVHLCAPLWKTATWIQRKGHGRRRQVCGRFWIILCRFLCVLNIFDALQMYLNVSWRFLMFFIQYMCEFIFLND